MKSIRFRFLIAALAVTLGAAIAKTQTADSAPPPPRHEHERDHGFGMDGHLLEFYAKYLDISDAQRTQMKEVLHKERSTMNPLMQQMHGMDQQLKQYEEGTFDEAKVQALVSQQAQTLVQLKVQETRIHNELYQLLTPDQQTRLKEFEARRDARMQKHMQSTPANMEQQ